MKKIAIAMFVAMLTASVAMGATPLEYRFEEDATFDNVLGRAYEVPLVRFTSESAVLTNSISVVMQVTQSDNLSTNEGATITVDYAIETLSFIGSTNWQPTELDIPEDAVLYMTNATAGAVNSIIMYRE